MERNLTSGLLVIYQGHSANLDPFQNVFIPLTKQGLRGATGACECVCVQNGQRREPGEPERMQVLKNMQMMTWQNATRKQRHGNYGEKLGDTWRIKSGALHLPKDKMKKGKVKSTLTQA